MDMIKNGLIVKQGKLFHLKGDETPIANEPAKVSDDIFNNINDPIDTFVVPESGRQQKERSHKENKGGKHSVESSGKEGGGKRSDKRHEKRSDKKLDKHTDKKSEKKTLNLITTENNSGSTSGKSSVSNLGRSSSLNGVVVFGSDGRLAVSYETGKETKIIRILEKPRDIGIDDRVVFNVATTDGEESALITKVLKKEIKFISGNFEMKGFQGVVYSDARNSRQIIIGKRDFNGAKSGDKVNVEILNPEDINTEGFDLEGKVIEILGKAGETDAELLSIARKYNLEKDFPADVLNEAKKIKFKSVTEGRLDLRDENIFTIDPVDARDFDDAVSIKKTSTGYKIGVHIADVSHYVKPGSPLDIEALKRATSVYFVTGVIPMLPEKLSNDICSLKPNVDRLTYSVIFELDKKLEVKKFDIKKTIINSKRRFTYEEAQEVIETGKGDFAADLKMMFELTQKLTKKRIADGALDFGSKEVKFVFDKKGKVKEIKIKERLDSMRLIEEFMLLANKCATLYIRDLAKEKGFKIPFVYRVHDNPDAAKIKTVTEFVKQFGFKLNVKDKKSINEVIESVKGRKEEFVINDMIIRSMAKAIYSENNIGHYGLGFEFYTHFTSPIRRYPDLIVHRMLNEYITEPKAIKKKVENYKNLLPGIVKHCSEKEQNATQAERESIKIKQIEYLQSRIGDVYEGMISALVQYGMFVEINDLLIEGMVRYQDIKDDYYEFDPKRHMAIGRRRKRIFQAGQLVKIKVSKVNMENKKIDFVLVQ